MKRLFILKNNEGKPVKDGEGNIQTFNTKDMAKMERDLLNKVRGNHYTVAPGPDHRNYVK